MIVADLPAARLRERLRAGGLRLRTGPVVSCIRSPLEDVAAGVALHYARHPVVDEGTFADFHVSVERPASLRRWWRPQVVFRFDGDAPFAPLAGDQGFPMLEWGLNWCVSVHCHDYLIVHAAAVARGEHAVVMPAPSGSGKSTLCAALVYGGGWRLMSDELALFDRSSGCLHSLARPVSLKNGSIDALSRFAPSARMGQVVHETVKGSVTHVQPPEDAVSAVDRPAHARWIVMPQYRAGCRAELRPLPRAQAFMRLVGNAFNYHVHAALGFELIADVVSAAQCFEFVYSDLEQACRVFDRLHDSS